MLRAGWPLLGAVQHAQYFDLAAYDPVHHDVVRVYDHFASAFDTTHAIEPGPLRQLGDLSIDCIAQFYRGNWIILRYEVDDPDAVSLGSGPPADLQTLASRQTKQTRDWSSARSARVLVRHIVSRCDY